MRKLPNTMDTVDAEVARMEDDVGNMGALVGVMGATVEDVVENTGVGTVANTVATVMEEATDIEVDMVGTVASAGSRMLPTCRCL